MLRRHCQATLSYKWYKSFDIHTELTAQLRIYPKQTKKKRERERERARDKDRDRDRDRQTDIHTGIQRHRQRQVQTDRHTHTHTDTHTHTHAHALTYTLSCMCTYNTRKCWFDCWKILLYMYSIFLSQNSAVILLSPYTWALLRLQARPRCKIKVSLIEIPIQTMYPLYKLRVR